MIRDVGQWILKINNIMTHISIASAFVSHFSSIFDIFIRFPAFTIHRTPDNSSWHRSDPPAVTLTI